MIDRRLFCLDTSAFVNPWRRMWPPDLAPRFWEDLASLASGGGVVVSEEVREELDRKDDELAKWARVHIREWHPLTDEVQAEVIEIMRRWGRLVDSKRYRSGADPFVVATARVTGATVVTDEGPGDERTMKIPYVCGQLGVPCLGLLEFVRAAKLRLG